MMVKQLNEKNMELYNDYVEFVNEYLNFEDTSVGIYRINEITKDIIKEIEENVQNINIIYWNKDTIIFKEGDNEVIVKYVTIDSENSMWTLFII